MHLGQSKEANVANLKKTIELFDSSLNLGLAFVVYAIRRVSVSSLRTFKKHFATKLFDLSNNFLLNLGC